MKKIGLILICIFVSTFAFAQPIPGVRPDDGGAGTHEDTQMPITTATAFLLILGSGYAVYNTHRKNKD
ncbi:MAG: hypothetical protein LBR17_05095 [Bacteroidales bacterium]|jgi:hypothetical protein|nr:hypothetical protein [Bacteroidales bacterium]